jgi:hypothetical protein
LEILEDRTLLNSPSATLAFSTYLGGSEHDSAAAVTVDTSGNIYVTGRTSSATDFPIRNAIQPILLGPGDAFVTKYDSSGTLIWSTYLGGSHDDDGDAIAVDASGNVYVAGTTSSPDFPTTAGAVQTKYNGQSTTGFVARFNASGSLTYATYLGDAGSKDFTFGNGIAVDTAGHIYVTGETSSAAFPTTPGATRSQFGGVEDAFVTEIDPGQSGAAELVYSTYLGGGERDASSAIAVDPSGNAYVTGVTASQNFPATASAFASHLTGTTSAFVAKLGPGGTLAYATYLGGGAGRTAGQLADNGGNGIAIDASGNVYVTGRTSSTQFPTTAGAVQSSLAGPSDAFVAKLDTTKSGASGLVWSTYLGGDKDDWGAAIAIGTTGSVAVTGFTASDNFPITSGAIQNKLAGGDDAFVVQLTASGRLNFSTYLGGSDFEGGSGIAADASGNLDIAGGTLSLNYPITVGTPPTIVGDANAFVSKLSLPGTPGGGGGGTGGGSSGSSGGGTSSNSGSSPSATSTNPSAVFRQVWLGLSGSINVVFQKAIPFLSNAIQIQGVIDTLKEVEDPFTGEQGTHVFLDLAQVTLSEDEVLLDIDSIFLSVEQVFSSLDQNTLGLDQVLLSLNQVFPGIEQATQSMEQATQSLDQVTLGLDQVLQSQDQVLEDINKVFGMP